MAVFRLGIIVVPLLLGACATTVPKVELDAYIGGYDKVQQTTNTLLELVVPFEREVMRSVASSAGSATSGDCPTGRNAYCYALRDAYATIGDPPLVQAVRRTSDVLLRFNKLLTAYTAGASAKLLAADYARLQARVGVLGGLVETASPGIGPAISIAKSLGSSVAGPLAASADRAQFGVFLQQNQANVDQAFGLLAESSEALYGNVRTATDIRKAAAANATERAALDQQRTEMRQLLANWTVLIDDVRVQLRELSWASAHPDGLETRLLNLGNAGLETSTNAEILNREIIGLIGNALSH